MDATPSFMSRSTTRRNTQSAQTPRWKWNYPSDEDDDQLDSVRSGPAVCGEDEGSKFPRSHQRPRRKAVILEDSDDEDGDVPDQQGTPIVSGPVASTPGIVLGAAANTPGIVLGTAAEPNQGNPDNPVPRDAPFFAVPSPYWELFSAEQGVRVKKYVLPLESDPMAGTALPAAFTLRAEDIRELEMSGMSSTDAEMLLAYCSGDVLDACSLPREHVDALLNFRDRRDVPAAPGAADSTVAAADKAACKAEELARVCTLFQDGGFPVNRLARVERVQNWRLRTSYACRKSKAPASEERFLWCGLSTPDVAEIILKGFGALDTTKTGATAENTLFVANASLAVDKALEWEAKVAQRNAPAAAAAAAARRRRPGAAEVQAAAAQRLVDQEPEPAAAAEHRPAAAPSAPAVGLGGRLLRVWSMLPRLVVGSDHLEQDLSEDPDEAPSSAGENVAHAQVPHSTSNAAVAQQTSRSSETAAAGTKGEVQPPSAAAAAAAAASRRLRAPSADFPGTGGALLLCRVMLSKIAVIADDDESDSVMSLETVIASQRRRAAAAGASRIPPPTGFVEDPAWNVSGWYAEDLAVSLRRAAVQAYPEYVVHFNAARNSA